MDMNLIYISMVVVGLVLIVGIYIFIHKYKKRERRYPPFTQALSLMLSGENERALEILREVIREDTSNIEAYILYGDILRTMGFYRKAAKIHKELTIRTGLRSDDLMRINRSLLQDYIEGGMYRQSLKIAAYLLGRNKSDLWTLKLKLRALEELGEWKNAAETAKKIQSITAKPDKEQLALYKVMEGIDILKKSGKEHDARLKFREAIKIDERFAWSYIELADSYLRDGRTGDAIKVWKQFFSNNPMYAYLVFDELESTLFELNKFQDLEKIYRELIERNPQNSRAFAALAKFMHRKGETDRAIAICREGLEVRPESLWLRRNLFKYLALDGKLAEAAEVGLEVLKMVTQEKEEFSCKECGYLTTKPLWRCPKCKSWRSFKF